MRLQYDGTLLRCPTTSLPLLSRRNDVQPYVVHATFQKWHFEGKRSRFRENNLWLLDAPSYYSEGRRDVTLPAAHTCSCSHGSGGFEDCPGDDVLLMV